MKKLLVAVAAVAILTGGTALAQSFSAQYNTSQYAGAGLGIPLTGYYGISGLVTPNTDVRFRANILPYYGFGVNVGADVLTELTTLDDEGNFSLYGGGGPSIGFMSLAGGSGVYADVTGVLGLNFRFDEEYSVFTELGGGFGYGRVSSGPVSAGGILPAYRAALGFLFHF